MTVFTEMYISEAISAVLSIPDRRSRTSRSRSLSGPDHQRQRLIGAGRPGRTRRRRSAQSSSSRCLYPADQVRIAAEGGPQPGPLPGEGQPDPLRVGQLQRPFQGTAAASTATALVVEPGVDQPLLKVQRLLLRGEARVGQDAAGRGMVVGGQPRIGQLDRRAGRTLTPRAAASAAPGRSPAAAQACDSRRVSLCSSQCGGCHCWRARLISSRAALARPSPRQQAEAMRLATADVSRSGLDPQGGGGKHQLVVRLP